MLRNDCQREVLFRILDALSRVGARGCRLGQFFSLLDNAQRAAANSLMGCGGPKPRPWLDTDILSRVDHHLEAVLFVGASHLDSLSPW